MHPDSSSWIAGWWCVWGTLLLKPLPQGCFCSNCSSRARSSPLRQNPHRCPPEPQAHQASKAFEEQSPFPSASSPVRSQRPSTPAAALRRDRQEQRAPSPAPLLFFFFFRPLFTCCRAASTSTSSGGQIRGVVPAFRHMEAKAGRRDAQTWKKLNGAKSPRVGEGASTALGQGEKRKAGEAGGGSAGLVSRERATVL